MGEQHVEKMTDYVQEGQRKMEYEERRVDPILNNRAVTYGDSPNTGRLVEVIMHGCVPLIISERLQPPVHDLLDWSKFAFFVREESVPDLPRILREELSTPEGQRLIDQKH